MAAEAQGPPPRAVFLLGPTASGKSEVALALARRFPSEIVSVDSAQVYRGMDVGTAKPAPEDRRRVAHHLIDLVDPTEAYSAGRFRDDAIGLVRDIAARGRVPILAGGTMLYFRALTRGLAPLPRADPAIRAELERRGRLEGWPKLHAELARVDPETAARLEPSDSQRIQRALEVHAASGRPMSALLRETAATVPALEALRIAFEPSDRAVLHRRIEERFARMLRAGLVEELEGLRRRFRLDASLPAMRCVGYRQAWETLEGRASAATLPARGAAATRQLAKRQLTWIRAMEGVERFDALRPDLADAVAARVSAFLEGPRTA